MFKGDAEGVGVVLGTRSDSSGDRDCLNKFQEKLNQYSTQHIDYRQVIPPMPKYNKDPWLIMKVNHIKKLTHQGNMDPVDSEISMNILRSTCEERA